MSGHAEGSFVSYCIRHLKNYIHNIYKVLDSEKSRLNHFVHVVPLAANKSLPMRESSGPKMKVFSVVMSLVQHDTWMVQCYTCDTIKWPNSLGFIFSISTLFKRQTSLYVYILDFYLCFWWNTSASWSGFRSFLSLPQFILHKWCAGRGGQGKDW